MAVFCLCVGACSGAPDVTYISREKMKSVDFAQEMSNYSGRTIKKPLSLGAIRITRPDAKEGELGQLFLLQRKKSTYMAETMVKNTGKQRYFLSIGIDIPTQRPAFGFRMEF